MQVKVHFGSNHSLAPARGEEAMQFQDVRMRLQFPQDRNLAIWIVRNISEDLHRVATPGAWLPRPYDPTTNTTIRPAA